MKKLMSILLVGLLFIPMLTNADSKEYVSQNLEEALTEEGIEHDLGDYTESEDKINIYLFRGNGCGHCKAFLTFLSENIDELGKYFNLVSYEIFGNQNNSKLMSQVSKFFGEEATGVPYIVIGDEYFAGYGEGLNEDIKKAIKELYESKDRYDVFEEMNKPVEEPKDASPAIIMWNAFFVTVATVVILFINNRKFNELNAKIDKLQKNNNFHKQEKNAQKK